MSAPAHEGTRSFANVWRSINARASLRRTYTLRSPGNVTIGSIRMIASAAARVTPSSAAAVVQSQRRANGSDRCLPQDPASDAGRTA